ncbi:MAG: class I SAM-dependent methyltransferase [Paludibacter sp.]|nr:class I SAM-dependent methyltransferase [Paludibacter sp.]
MNDNFAHRAAEWDSPEKIKMTEIFVAEMLQQVELKKTWKALELGAGTGLVGMQVLSRLGSVVFEDTSAAMLGVLKEKLNDESPVEIVHGEVYDYNKQDIDLVFSCMAFHHVPDIERTIHHLAAITNPDGLVVIGDLLTEDGSFHRFEPIPHKGFDLDMLRGQFEKGGFEILVAQPYHTLRRERVEGIVTEYTQFILVTQKRSV